MNTSLRTRLLGTIVVAILLFFIMSVVAARLTLQHDLMDLGKGEVTSGSRAFGGYWAARKEQIRLLVAQDASSAALRRDVMSHATSSLQDQLANIARTSGLSWLTIVDSSGRVLARATGTNLGSLAGNKYVARAETGETVATAALVAPNELRAEGLAAQAAATITNAAGKTVEHLDRGLAIVSAAPMSDSNQRTIGVIYGGVLMNHSYDLVDESTKALGGATALLDGDAVVASSITQPNGMRLVDSQIPLYDSIVENGRAYTGPDLEGGTLYLARIDPISNDQNDVIGALWYGVPMAQISAIVDHMTETFVLWGIVATIVALLIAVPLAGRISASIAERSEQISSAAKELGVTIVGGEVSGDHVRATKAAVGHVGELLENLAAGGDPSGKIAQLKAANAELAGDMIVIDTLSQEMSDRLQTAVTRVAELNDVAAALDKLVHGSSK